MSTRTIVRGVISLPEGKNCWLVSFAEGTGIRRGDWQAPPKQTEGAKRGSANRQTNTPTVKNSFSCNSSTTCSSQNRLLSFTHAGLRDAATLPRLRSRCYAWVTPKRRQTLGSRFQCRNLIRVGQAGPCQNLGYGEMSANLPPMQKELAMCHGGTGFSWWYGLLPLCDSTWCFFFPRWHFHPACLLHCRRFNEMWLISSP